jgi:isopenicillin N synthase-like dioxygenase
MQTDSIPIVDFEGYLNGDANSKLATSETLVSSMRKSGFVYLKNFGISNEECAEMFELSSKFFQAPLHLKQSVKKCNKTFCGYDQIGLEKLSTSGPGDYKESFMIKPGCQWPLLPECNQFKERLLDFHAKCNDLGFNILKSLIQGLDVEGCLNIEKEFYNGDCTILRLLHYPPIPDDHPFTRLRCGEHTDYGVLTLLFQDSVGGLEIKNKEMIWQSVPYVKDTILVNLGDCTELWTRGYLTATPHRVVNTIEEDKAALSRYSTAFFFEPDMSCELKPFEKFQNLNYEQKFFSKTYGEHITQKFVHTYDGYFDS